eukprot:m.442194 g.442194  ORF g.442194 m.442194 type:complete len:510 (-) comp21472_c0_seq2:583-2112(-)
MPAAQELQALAETDPGASVARLQEFISVFSSGSPEECVCATDGLATLARHEEYRSDIGNSAIIGELIEILKRMKSAWNENLCANTLRALGNLCFDHDDNREKVIACDGASQIVEIVHRIVNLLSDAEFVQNPESKLHLAASGVVVNMCNGNESVQSSFSNTDIPRYLVQLYCRSKMNYGRMMALQAMSTLDEVEAMLKALCESEEAIDILLNSVQEAVTENRGAFTTEDISPPELEKSGAQATPAKSPALEACGQELHLLRQCVNKCEDLIGFRSTRVISALVSLCSGCGVNKREEISRGRMPLSASLPPRDVTANAALVLSCVMGDDECQRQAIQIQSTHSGGDDGLQVLIRWFASWMAGDIGARPHHWDIPSAGAVALGNIARTAETALLVQQCDGVVASLFKMVSSNKISLQFAALNTLKNLSVLELNRPAVRRFTKDVWWNGMLPNLASFDRGDMLCCALLAASGTRDNEASSGVSRFPPRGSAIHDGWHSAHIVQHCRGRCHGS